MFKLLKAIANKDDSSLNIEDVVGKPFEIYLQKELNSCSYVKIEFHNIALAHLTHKTNLNKTENRLTAEEKKSIGISARLSITHELVKILTSEGIRQYNPKEILSGIYYRAFFAKNRDDSLEKFKASGIRKYTLMTCNDGKDCEWCNSQQGIEMSVDEDLNEIINNNCTCSSHCRCVMKPILKF
jgi:hypothetical protein